MGSPRTPYLTPNYYFGAKLRFNSSTEGHRRTASLMREWEQIQRLSTSFALKILRGPDWVLFPSKFNEAHLHMNKFVCRLLQNPLFISLEHIFKNVGQTSILFKLNPQLRLIFWFIWLGIQQFFMQKILIRTHKFG